MDGRNCSREVRPHKPAPRREEVARERVSKKGASESRRIRNDAGRTRPVEVFDGEVTMVLVADGKVFTEARLARDLIPIQGWCGCAVNPSCGG